MSEYFDELEKYRDKFPRVSGDFFPYSDGGDYWTGYYTSRPFLKRRERVLQVRNSLYAQFL